MRRFKLQTQVSVDGYMGGPEGEMDWLTMEWSDDVAAYITEMIGDVDTIVLGRHLAEGFIPHWAAKPEHEPDEAIEFMNATPKVVISNTLTTSPWEGTTVAGGDVASVVGELKAREGGDLVAYGGAQLVQSLVAHELLDDLHLFVNPTAIGRGLPVFPEGAHRFQTVAATRFECGITALHLQPRR